MTLFEAIFLGIIQGLTEFLPISSSGHLVIGQNLLGIYVPGNLFEVVVHVGTLFSILVVFKDDWINLLRTVRERESAQYLLTIFLGTIPAVFVGLLFKDSIEKIFDSMSLVAGALMFTGLILLVTKWLTGRGKKISVGSGFLMGCAQALAIIPGISRSGATISTGLVLGLGARDAARFSFLLAIPAICGAGTLTGIDLMQGGLESISSLALTGAFLSSFLVGVAALKWLLGLLESGKFYWFGIYCFLVGGLTLSIG